MIKAVKCFFALLCFFILTAFCGCADRYAPIESTEDELKVVATVEGYDVFYDELRFLTVTSKKALTETYGVDWNDEAQSQEYSDELSSMVWDNLIYNYGVILMFDEIYGDYGEIDKGISAELTEFIDLCGSREEYISYLSENALTDRLLRFNLRVDLCELELLSYYSELTGEIDTGYDAVYGDYMLGDDADAELIRVLHICIEGDSEESRRLALDLRRRILAGEDAFALAAEYSSDFDAVGEDGEYISRGDYSAEYEHAAFSLAVGEISPALLIGSDHYLICRLEKDFAYISKNYEYLYQKYVYLEFDKIASDFTDKLELEKTSFGEGLDLVNVN